MIHGRETSCQRSQASGMPLARRTTVRIGSERGNVFPLFVEKLVGVGASDALRILTFDLTGSIRVFRSTFRRRRLSVLAKTRIDSLELQRRKFKSYFAGGVAGGVA